MHKVIDTDSLRKVLGAANLLNIEGAIKNNKPVLVTNISEVDNLNFEPQTYTVDEIISKLEANTQGEMFINMEKRLDELEAENELLKDQVLDFYIYKILFEEMIDNSEIDYE